MKKKVNLADRIRHEEDYISFLEKRLASKHFLNNESKKEIEKVKGKLSKAILVLKVLRSGKS